MTNTKANNIGGCALRFFAHDEKKMSIRMKGKGWRE